MINLWWSLFWAKLHLSVVYKRTFSQVSIKSFAFILKVQIKILKLFKASVEPSQMMKLVYENS